MRVTGGSQNHWRYLNLIGLFCFVMLSQAGFCADKQKATADQPSTFVNYRENAFSIQSDIQSTDKSIFITPFHQSFEILSVHSVLDRASNLVWLRQDDDELRSWKEAKLWCESLSTEGRSWRLPERAELLSLVDFGKSDPAIDLYYFPNTKSFNYWAITPYTGTPSHAWSILFSEGNAYCFVRELKNYARCVSENA